MANGQGSIDEIIGQQAIKQVEDFTVSLKKLTDEMSTALKIANDLNSATGLKNVSAAINATTQATSNAAKVQKEYTLAIAQEKLQRQELRKELDMSAKQMKAEEGSIQQLRNDLADLQRQYDAMGKASREAFGKPLLDSIQKTDTALKQLEATTGRYQRSVGNYAQATYSLSQVFREMPAFAYSASQGILALSNNLPILIDQFKLVQAETGSTVKAFGIFARSIFSWVNILTVGIGVLTVWMARSSMAKDKTEEHTEALKRQKSAFDSSLQSGEKEVIQLQVLYALATDVTKSLDDRRKAVAKMQELYPDYLGKIEKEAIMAGKAKDAYLLLNQELEKAIYFRAFQALAEEQSQNLPKLQLMYDEIGKELAKRVSENRTGVFNMTDEEREKDQQYLINISNRLKQIPGIGDEASALVLTQGLKGAYNIIGSSIGEIGNKVRNTLSYAEQYASKFGVKTKDVVGGGGSSSTESNRIDQLRKEYEQEKQIEEIKFRDGLQSELEYQINLAGIEAKYRFNKLEAIKNMTTKEAQEATKFKLELVKDYDEIIKKLAEVGEAVKRALKGEAQGNVSGASKNITESANQYMEKFNKLIADLKGEMGSVNLGTDHSADLEAWAEGLEKVLKIVNDLSSAISDISSIFIDKELRDLDVKEKRLKQYYDNEKRFIEQSGYSSLQKKKMEAKLDAENEAKKKQIDRDRITALRKQAAIQKALDIVAIIGNTAKAVTELLATPYLAVAAGIAGAAQLARVIATPLPQYAKGRKGGKKEWAVVGEAGQEAIVHNGRVELTPNAPTVTLLPEGASVIPNHELIKNAAYVHLAKQGTVTTDKLQAALIESYERNTKELQQIKAVLIDKNFSFTNNELSGYESYRQSKVQ